MDIKDKIELVKANIWKAIDDYKAHTKQTEVLDDITGTFVGNLAEDNISAKRELRELFREHRLPIVFIILPRQLQPLHQTLLSTSRAAASPFSR